MKKQYFKIGVSDFYFKSGNTTKKVNTIMEQQITYRPQTITFILTYAEYNPKLVEFLKNNVAMEIKEVALLASNITGEKMKKRTINYPPVILQKFLESSRCNEFTEHTIVLVYKIARVE